MGRYGEGQIVLFARKNEDASAASEPAVQAPPEKSWLVFADNGGIGETLAARLRAVGAGCKIVRRGTGFATADTDTFTIRPDALEDWQQLFQTYAGDAGLERIVYLWNLDLEFDNDAVFGTDALLHLAQALETVLPAAKLRIDYPTMRKWASGKRTPQKLAQDEICRRMEETPV
jgi:hypothetical protein